MANSDQTGNSEKPRRRGVVAVIVRKSRFLVILRSQHVAAPGKVCFPGGAIEGSEDEPTALGRELQEELNVSITPTGHLWRSQTPWGVQLSWWQAELPPGAAITPNEAEVESFAWQTAEELLADPRLLTSNRDFFAALQQGEFTLAGVTAREQTAD